MVWNIKEAGQCHFLFSCAASEREKFCHEAYDPPKRYRRNNPYGWNNFLLCHKRCLLLSSLRLLQKLAYPFYQSSPIPQDLHHFLKTLKSIFMILHNYTPLILKSGACVWDLERSPLRFIIFELTRCYVGHVPWHDGLWHWFSERCKSSFHRMLHTYSLKRQKNASERD